MFFSTLFNTASSAASQPVLPTGRMFGRITQKGPSKKDSGLTNQRPILGRYFHWQGRKRAEFWNSFAAFTFPPYEWITKLYFSQIFTLKWFKNWPNFDQTREKMSVLHRGELFFYISAAEYFGQSGRIILERVGNTALNSNSTVSEDAGIEPRTVATSTLAVRRSTPLG